MRPVEYRWVFTTIGLVTCQVVWPTGRWLTSAAIYTCNLFPNMDLVHFWKSIKPMYKGNPGGGSKHGGTLHEAGAVGESLAISFNAPFLSLLPAAGQFMAISSLLFLLCCSFSYYEVTWNEAVRRSVVSMSHSVSSPVLWFGQSTSPLNIKWDCYVETMQKLMLVSRVVQIQTRWVAIQNF